MKLHKEKDPVVEGVKFWRTSPLASSSSQCPHRASPNVTDGSCRVDGNRDGGGVQESGSLDGC